MSQDNALKRALIPVIKMATKFLQAINKALIEYPIASKLIVAVIMSVFLIFYALIMIAIFLSSYGKVAIMVVIAALIYYSRGKQWIM